MIEIPAGNLEQPKQWRGGTRDGVRTALLSCPGCGEIASLSGHEIAADGRVSPSVVCPYDCGFHDFIVLAGWTPG